MVLVPLLYLSFFIASHPDPIKFLYTVSGLGAFWILLFMLLLPLLSKIGLNLKKHRRFLGLVSFGYAFLHVLGYVAFESEFSFGFIIKETFDKPFIFLGMGAFLILTCMAMTSTKKAFKRYKAFHQMIYLGIILAVTHYLLGQKVLGVVAYVALSLVAIVLLFKIYLYSSSHNKNTLVL